MAPRRVRQFLGKGGMMSTYDVALIKRVPVAEGTMAFHFGRPPSFRFKAGQAIDVTLISPPQTDAEGDTRTFSLVSAPHEDELVVATRMRDTAFKRTLGMMEPGSEVRITGPFGALTLHEDAARPAVFLAGGIGITPFVSMSRQAAHDATPHHIYLFYSNRRPEDAAFLEELQMLEQRNPRYRLIPTMTDMPRSNRYWQGETAFIGESLLRRHLGDVGRPVYYVAGPPAMVAALHEMLAGMQIGEGSIRIEEFAGY